MVKRKEELMQENGAMHVTRSTRFLPLEVSAVLPQVDHVTTMHCPDGSLMWRSSLTPLMCPPH